MSALDTILGLLDVVAMAAFAASGALAAARARMDIVGFALIAAVTGFGGGTLRDLLLGRLPLFWLKAPGLLALTTAVAVVVFFGAHRLAGRGHALLWADALGLAMYAVLGAEIARTAGADPWAAVLLGVVTATFGGILRDVICNQVPLILRKEIYALAALAGAALFILLCEAEVRRDVAIPAGMALAFAIRAAAIRFGWSLPPYRGPA
ncbi:MAG: TRIC cation channel family protein [Rhodovarius sp.]|nr:TRIC cation channel family protein [Rhodovarius sp.]MDW8313534.1 TRIC cation channel family protein [Rhodovarius sp.]